MLNCLNREKRLSPPILVSNTRDMVRVVRDLLERAEELRVFLRLLLRNRRREVRGGRCFSPVRGQALEHRVDR